MTFFFGSAISSQETISSQCQDSAKMWGDLPGLAPSCQPGCAGVWGRAQLLPPGPGAVGRAGQVWQQCAPCWQLSPGQHRTPTATWGCSKRSRCWKRGAWKDRVWPLNTARSQSMAGAWKEKEVLGYLQKLWAFYRLDPQKVWRPQNMFCYQAQAQFRLYSSSPGLKDHVDAKCSEKPSTPLWSLLPLTFLHFLSV